MGNAQTEQNKEVVRRFYEEVMNQGNTAVLEEIMDAEFDDHGEALFGSPHGRQLIEGGVQYVHTILPDLHVRLEDMIASGDMVGVRGVMTCTHSGEFVGVPGTGNELSWKGIALFRLKDGKIVERWFNSDSLNIMTQLGLYPPPAAAAGEAAAAPMTPQEVVDTYYRSVNAGDWQTWLTLFADDVEMDEQLAGKVNGIETLRGAVGMMEKGYSKFQNVPKRIVINGDEAAAFTHISAANASGVPIEADAANFFRIRNGKIVYMANIHDTVPFGPFMNQQLGS